jgi:hypothetical protein
VFSQSTTAHPDRHNLWDLGPITLVLFEKKEEKRLPDPAAVIKIPLQTATL